MSGIDALLKRITDGLPRVPKRYELRCHPDVYLALKEAALVEPEQWPPIVRDGQPLYGHADIVVDPELASGEYRITEDGSVIKEGTLAS